MPSGPESRTWISPSCQTALLPSRIAPGRSALAVVLTPQTLPIVVSAVVRQSIGIGKPVSLTVADSELS
jgi:hypothetical protein